MLLTMGSTTAPDDRTARARIRDAAIEVFGNVGYERATLREIAARAGVTHGLVLHHFGSKVGLRDACDEHVVGAFARSRGAMTDSGDPNPFSALAALREEATHRRYLMRSLRDGGTAGARVFDDIVRTSQDLTRRGVETGLLRPEAADDDVVTLLVAWQFGALVLQDHVSRAFGASVDTDEMTARVARAALSILTDGVFADRRYLDAWSRAAAPGTVSRTSEEGASAPAPSGASERGEEEVP